MADNYLDKSGLPVLWGKIKAKINSINAKFIDGVLPIPFGGTGGNTAKSAMRNLLAGTPVATTPDATSNSYIPFYRMSDDIVEQLPFSNLYSLLNNRTTSVDVANISYTTYMARGISLQSSVPSSITNGCVVFVYS